MFGIMGVENIYSFSVSKWVKMGYIIHELVVNINSVQQRDKTSILAPV